MSPGELAHAYIGAVNAADEGALLALFGAGAVLHHPTGEHTGLVEIGAFYRDLVFAGKAELTLGEMLADERLAMFQLTASSPLDDHASVVRTMDVIVSDASGLIDELFVYYSS